MPANPSIALSDGFRRGPLWKLDSTPSTMDAAREAPPCGGLPLTVVAREQTSGRGRHDRVWKSPAGGGLYLTVRIPWKRPVAQAPVVSMGAALALARLAEGLGCPDVVLKWPNDLLLRGAKAAGLLAEMSDTPDGQALMVGVGLNVSTPPSVLERVGQPATSLRDACPDPIDLDGALRGFLDSWTEIDTTLEAAGFAALAEEYRRHSDLEGREFLLATAGASERVRFVRVNDDGSLSLRRSSGEVFATFGGELVKI